MFEKLTEKLKNMFGAAPAKPAAAPADEKRPDALLDLDNFESLKERI